MDNNEKQELKNPRENASLISIATFAWLYKMFRLGFTRKLETSDIYSVLQEQSCDVIGPRVLKFWQKESVRTKAKDQRKYPSLIKVLAQTFKNDCFIITFVLIFNRIILRLIEACLLMKFLSFFKEKEGKLNQEVYYWALGLMVVKFLTSIIYHLNSIHSSHLGLKVKVASSCLIYRKILSLSKSSLRNGTSVGQVTNLMSDDVRILQQLVFYIFYILLVLIQFICFVLVIYWQIGLVPILAYLFSMIIVPVQGYIGKWISVKIQKRASLTDKRLSLMSEIINGIQVIKMYAWEKPFSSLVDKTRAKEMKVIKRMAIVHILVKNVRLCITQFSLFIAIVGSIAFGTSISAEKVYMLVLIYTEVKSSVYMMFMSSLELLAKGIVSAQRIEAFLNCQEKKPHPSNFFGQKKDVNPIRISKVSAKWSSASKDDTIQNLTLTLSSGTLTAIIGQVGSGKSSLLQIILGELPILGGHVQVFGKISYASQEPWIFASTVRQNIIFGRPMNKIRYDEVIRVCQLQKDFASFTFGDGTLIGEKGIKLSGGQRARLNLARAVYSEADIYIFDDPLSAVDAEVGKRIFEDCFCGFLKDKTRILVTHQLQFLKSVDRILMLKSGSLQAQGTLEEVMKSDIDFLKMLNVKKQEDIEEDIDDISETLKLIQNEAQEEKEVSELKTVNKDSKGVFWSYLKAVESPWLVFLTVFLGLLYQSILTGGDYVLSRWMNVEESISSRRTMNGTLVVTEELEIQRQWYIQMCSIFYTAVIVILFIYSLAFNEVVMRSSEKLHQSMFYSVIRATMLFFRENSSGRILNRFSKDISTVDKLLPDCLSNTVAIGLSLLAVLSITLAYRPWSVIFILILVFFLYFLCTIYMRTIYSVKHLEAALCSPVFSHVNATLDGLITIRAFNAEEILDKEFKNHQDIYTSAQFLFLNSTRALGYYLELFTLLFITILICLLIIFSENSFIGDVGLILTQWFSLCITLQYGVRQSTELESHLTSVERILDYTDLEQEPTSESKEENKPNQNWPSKGRLEFQNVFLSYHSGGVAVLKNLNFVVLPREKIGIVGRTGAGKTSLIVALFRLAYLEGEIYIDDVETSRLDLDDLRSNISIIPQQPFLFSGSLRRNLDPFDEHSDEELWQALEDVELKDVLKVMESGLDMEVFDGGSNFSVGQRQLLSLARAIVKKNKVLVLDEATANVDIQTDELIQKTIRRRFKDCTVLIIAHRLNTVMDCDKFIVMDAGLMVEFDHPHSLLKNKDGYLYKMVQQTGSDMTEILLKIAEQNFRNKRIN